MALAGRPATGPTEESRQRARELLIRHDANSASMTQTASVEMLAAEEGRSVGWVWGMISLARGRVPMTLVGQASEPSTAQAPKPKPRMSQRTLLYRAWIAMRLIDVFRLLGDPVAMFWINTVLQVHELGEDGALSFGGLGDAYRSRDELAQAAGRTAAELDDLIHRGLLIGLDGGGLALPVRFGLRPRERLGGDLVMGVSLPPTRPAKGHDPRQASLPPMGMPRPDSREIHPWDSSQITPRDSSEIGGGDSSEIGGGDSSQIRHAPGEKKGTTTTTKEESLFGGGGLATAGTGEAANLSGVDSSQITLAGDAAPPWCTLAAELLSIVGRPGHPTPAEMNEVRGLLEEAIPPELIRDVVRQRAARKNAPSMPALGYFSQAIRDRASRPPAAPVKGAVISPEDKATWDLVRPATDAWAADKACPFPPGLGSFNAAVASGDASLAHRWLTVFAAWDVAGRPGAARPPDFTLLAGRREDFEADLMACEDELTAPDVG